MGRLVRIALGLAALATLGAMAWVFLPRPETRLTTGEEQSFGFFDPHLHVAVMAVERPMRWGDHEPGGAFHLVTVRTRNSAVEMEIRIDPDDLEVFVRAPDGGRHAPVLHVGGPSTLAGTIEGRLGPGETWTRTFLFDLPEDVEPLLAVTYAHPLARFIPDQANGFLRRDIVFDLTP